MSRKLYNLNVHRPDIFRRISWLAYFHGARDDTQVNFNKLQNWSAYTMPAKGKKKNHHRVLFTKETLSSYRTVTQLSLVYANRSTRELANIRRRRIAFLHRQDYHRVAIELRIGTCGADPLLRRPRH